MDKDDEEEEACPPVELETIAAFVESRHADDVDMSIEGMVKLSPISAAQK